MEHLPPPGQFSSVQISSERLESLEKRKSFDVHAYRSKVINKCEDQEKTEVPFKDVIRGEKKEEVCR